MAAVFLQLARAERAARIPAGVTMHDAMLTDFLEPAEQAVLEYLSVPFLTQTTVGVTFDVSAGQGALLLDVPYLQSVSALTNDGSAVAAGDFYIDQDNAEVRLLGGAFFSSGYQKAAVTAVCGYSPVPEWAVQAAAFTAAAMFNQGGHAGFESEGMSKYRYKLSEDLVPPLAQALLNGHRRIMPRRSKGPVD